MAPIGPWGSGFAADTLPSSAAAISRRTSTVFCRAACSTRKSEKEISRIEHKQKGVPDAGRLLLVQSWRHRRRGLELQPQ